MRHSCHHVRDVKNDAATLALASASASSVEVDRNVDCKIVVVAVIVFLRCVRACERVRVCVV